MNKLNWGRLFWCGLLAGVIWIILGSLVTSLLRHDFEALPNNRLARPAPGFLLFYLTHVLWRHRDTQLLSIPPPAIHRILLPVVLIIARILGKYRGSSWPGSPESCPGAPLVGAEA